MDKPRNLAKPSLLGNWENEAMGTAGDLDARVVPR